MENIDCFHLLTSSDKLDRLCHNRSDTQCRTTACITIKLCQNDTVKIKAVIECLCRIHGILTGHGVNNEECLVGIDGILQSFYLVHHLFINGETTGGIYNNDIVALCLSLLYGIVGNLYDILVSIF